MPWTEDETKAENHWRRTFCQVPFGAIYDHADKGKRSLHRLVEFFRRKADAERSASDELRTLLHEQLEQGSLEDLEERGTSIRRALMEVQIFVDATCNQQMLLAKVLEEQVAEPLVSLQAASEVYIHTLREEIKNVNDEYSAAQSSHAQAAWRVEKTNEQLVEAKERQRIALHGIGVPEFELQRLAHRVAKCSEERAQAELVKAQAKTLLYNRIIARDEMAMAVSVAYQKAEEERLDQLTSCVQRFLHVEKERVKVSSTMLASLEQHIQSVNRSEDIQLLIHNRRNPENMHFQGKALALLDWHWGKMQMEKTHGHGHNGLVEFHPENHQQPDKRSSSLSDLAMEPLVISTSRPDRAASSASNLAASPGSSNPHDAIMLTPMGSALHEYFEKEHDVAPITPQPNLEIEVESNTIEDTQEDQTDIGTIEMKAGESNVQSDAESTVVCSSQIIKDTCGHQAGRALFVKCLNRQRSLETKVKDQASFDRLVECFNVFLDACMREDDVKAAKTAMILAETFYLPKAVSTETSSGTIDGLADGHLHHHHGPMGRGASRIYLQEQVKKHAIWKSPSFWEKALLLAIGEELQKTPQQIPWEDLPSDVPKHDGLPSREEAVARVHNIVFGQLGSFTLSMLEFDVPFEQIESFVETMCDAHELTEDQRFLLRKNLQEIFATLR